MTNSTSLTEGDIRSANSSPETIQSDFWSDLKIQRTGVADEGGRKIYTMRYLTGDNLDAYTAGLVLGLWGGYIKNPAADLGQGVFFRDEAGTKVGGGQYIDSTQGILTVMVPGGLTGPQELLVWVKYGNNLREAVSTCGGSKCKRPRGKTNDFRPP